MSKEKLDRDMIVKVQNVLYEKFKDTCDRQLKSISATVRDLMMKYIEEHPNSWDGKK